MHRNQKIIKLKFSPLQDDVNSQTRNKPWNGKYFDVRNFFRWKSLGHGAAKQSDCTRCKTQWELNLKTIKLELIKEILFLPPLRRWIFDFYLPNPSPFCSLLFKCIKIDIFIKKYFVVFTLPTLRDLLNMLERW